MSKSKSLKELGESTAKPRGSSKRIIGQRHRIVRFLIVCEGQETEPNYFKALLSDRYSAVRSVELKGQGQTTVALVEKAQKIRENLERKTMISFDRVWVVFDEDQKSDFNAAINLARKYHLQAAWSNESFELWFCLHFEYLTAGIDRYQYIKKLEGYIKKRSGKIFVYRKNDTAFYSLLKNFGDEETAKKNASKLRRRYTDKDYKSHKPCTMVDKLVEELEEPEKLL